MSRLDNAILPSQDVRVRRLDPDSNLPPYLQIADAIRDAIRTGELRAGEQIPSRAELAARFDVSPMTVTNAVRLLQAEGVLVGRQGTGVFVHTNAASTAPPVTFAHVLTVEPHSVELHQCSGCAALVMPAGRDQHAHWHRHHGE